MNDAPRSQHDWQVGESVQWGAAGLPSTAAATPFWCVICGVRFVHHYNVEPDFQAAMRSAGIDPDSCQEVTT